VESASDVFALSLVFFLTSVVSVVSGSTSLITVPAMMQLGVEPPVAVATNMFALTFLSTGGAYAFRGKDVVDQARLPALVGLTVAGSILGAPLLLVVPSRSLPGIVSVLMIAVALFSALNRHAGVVSPAESSADPMRERAGRAATFLLGAYGGFFSGGYVTLLTAAFVALFRMTFVEAVATTKVVNLFSSGVATLVFLWRGLVDWELGLLLGAVMFVGGIVGGHVSVRLSNRWLRRIFLAVVFALAGKTLLDALR
jgi:uncharacterized protein